MRRIAPLLITLIAGYAATTAHALAQNPASDTARLAQFLPIARAAWPASPCTGREQVHLGGDVALRAAAPSVAGPGEALNGMATPATCEVWLSAEMDARTFCAVLVHELGHLAGRDHVTTPGDIMNAEGDIDWPACDNATDPPATERIEGELRSILPAPRAAWRVTCGERRGTHRRCVARRGHSLRRYAVTERRTTVTVVRED
jgi:hypothetical protein